MTEQGHQNRAGHAHPNLPLLLQHHPNGEDDGEVARRLLRRQEADQRPSARTKHRQQRNEGKKLARHEKEEEDMVKQKKERLVGDVLTEIDMRMQEKWPEAFDQVFTSVSSFFIVSTLPLTFSCSVFNVTNARRRISIARSNSSRLMSVFGARTRRLGAHCRPPGPNKVGRLLGRSPFILSKDIMPTFWMSWMNI